MEKTTGFASPAQGYEAQSIDLNSLLIHNPPATYFFRLNSSEMSSLGLQNGALLVVDCSKTAVPNNFVLLRHEGNFYCRLMIKEQGRVVFTNGTETINPVSGETEIIGVITANIQTYDNAH